MAILSVGKVGKNNFKVSVVKSELLSEIFSKNEQQWYYSHKSPVFGYDTFISNVDIGDMIRNSSLNEEVTIIELNEKIIYYKVTARQSKDMGKGNPDTISWCTCFFYISDINKTSPIQLFAGNFVEHRVFNTKTLNFPFFIFLLVDETSTQAKIYCYRPSSEDNVVYTESSLNSAYQWTFSNAQYKYSTGVSGYSPTAFYNDIKGLYSEYSSDPWSDAGIADTGGGEGTFDFNSDSVALPELTAPNACDTGFVRLFRATLNEIRQLSNYMWTGDLLTSFVRITADPIDTILSLQLFPFTLNGLEKSFVYIGNVRTNIEMEIVQQQYVEIDCGNLNVEPFYGAYLDFEPFSKCEIFLPYCGTHTISIDDIMGKIVNIRYRIDLLTGSCVVFIIVNDNVLYTFSGMCGATIPLSSRNFENTYNALFNVATSLANPMGTIGALTNIASNVMQSKPTITHSGNMSSNLGVLGVQKPHFIFTVPRVAIPKNQNKFLGYPIYATYKIGDLKGFTVFDSVFLNNMGHATKEEISKITNLLKGGVIL